MIDNIVKNIKLIQLKNKSTIYILHFNDSSYVHMCNLEKLYYNSFYRDGNINNSEIISYFQMHDDIKCRRINKLYKFIIHQSKKFNKVLPDYIFKIITNQSVELKFSDEPINAVLNFVLTEKLVEYYACDSHRRNNLVSYGILENVKHFYGVDHFYISQYNGCVPSGITGTYFRSSIIQFFNRV